MKTLLKRLCKGLFGTPRDGLTMPLYRGRFDGLHELTEDYSIRVKVSGIPLDVTVKKGFVFDGASIPHGFWPFLGHPMTPPRVAAALIHDWLHKAQPVPKAVADIIYAKVQAMAGISYPSIAIEWIALVFFSGRYWRKNAQGNILDARRYGAIEFAAIPPQKNTKEREKEHE